MRNILRKASCLLMVLVLVFSLAACGCSKSSSDSSSPSELEKLIAEQGPEMEQACEASFEASSGGLTCECTVYAEGTKIVMDICIDDLDECPDDIKTSLQDAYDSMTPQLEEQFAPFKDLSKELTGVIYNVCEEDGDVLATVTIDLN